MLESFNNHIDIHTQTASQIYEVSIDEKHKTNLPTEKGIQLGITVKVQQNTEGKDFQKVIYSISAQKFLLTNIESIAISR